MDDGGLRVRLERPFPSPHGDHELLELAHRVACGAHGGPVTDGLLGSGERVVVKIGRRSPWRRRLDRVSARTTRSEVASSIALHLAQAGVRTPEVYGCVVARSRWGVARWDATVARALAADTLTDTLGADPKRAPALIDACAALIARMHGAGVFHGDLKGANLLVSGAACAPTVHVVDLEGSRRLGTMGMASRARDLGRLWVSLDVLGVDGARLVSAYGEAAGLGTTDGIAAGVARYARRKRRQNDRRGRPLT